MQTIDTYRPSHPLLRQAISAIVFWRNDADASSPTVYLPNNISGLGFTLYGDLCVRSGGDFKKMPPMGTRNVLQGSGEIITRGRFLNISVRCVIPNGLNLFTRAPMDQLYQQDAISLYDIFTRQQISDITEQLAGAASDRERVSLLEAFLLRHLVNNYPPQFAAIVKFIHEFVGACNLQQLARTFTTTERTIHRQFCRYVGITPNAYINLIRFRSVLSLSSRSRAHSTLSNAFEVGYYDQAHFIRHFKKLSTVTPAQYFRAGKNAGMSDFYNL